MLACLFLRVLSAQPGARRFARCSQGLFFRIVNCAVRAGCVSNGQLPNNWAAKLDLGRFSVY